MSNAITYIIQIKTEPHGGWFTPDGWGPYATRAEARAARRRADRLWMAVRIRTA